MTNQILLFHLNPEVSRELRDSLIGLRIVPEIEESPALAAVHWEDYDVVFCPASGADLQDLLQATKAYRPRLRIVAASRIPDETEWLQAMEAGATDYCAAPFEARQLQTLLQTQLNASSHPAA